MQNTYIVSVPEYEYEEATILGAILGSSYHIKEQQELALYSGWLPDSYLPVLLGPFVSPIA